MKRTDPFYFSPAWRALRRQVLDRDGWACTACGRSLVGRGAARIDHIRPKATHPHLARALHNLRSLCAYCDGQAHREKGAPGSPRDDRIVRRGADADGWPASNREVMRRPMLASSSNDA
jgi:5-methylcytosine-specific restriction endonuclease McrA